MPSIAAERYDPAMVWMRGGTAAAAAWGAVFVLSGCPSGDASVGVPTSGPGTSPGSTGGDESSTGIDTLADGSGGGTTAAPTVEVRCGEMPSAAVGASYEHAFEADPADASWTWTVQGLPAGMNISPISGAMSGVPEMAGTYALQVSVEGSAGVGEATCSLEVAEALSADLSTLDGACVGPGDDLTDVLVGGDGSPVTCSTPQGTGNGTRPDAVSVNETSCAIEGEPTADEFGAWVWITAVEQSGATAYVPFCVVQDEPAEDAFAITLTGEGGAEATTAPWVQTFAPDQPIAFGGDGAPRVEVVGGCGDAACYYGWVYQLGASPFGDCDAEPCIGMDPSGVLTDAMDEPIGLWHEMFARGPAVSETLAARPFVLPWQLTYCIADNDTACEGSDAVLANAGARLHVSVLMLPE